MTFVTKFRKFQYIFTTLKDEKGETMDEIYQETNHNNF